MLVDIGGVSELKYRTVFEMCIDFVGHCSITITYVIVLHHGSFMMYKYTAQSDADCPVYIYIMNDTNYKACNFEGEVSNISFVHYLKNCDRYG